MLYMASMYGLKRYEICILNRAIYDIEAVIFFEKILDKYKVSLSVPLAH